MPRHFVQDETPEHGIPPGQTPNAQALRPGRSP
jgi:hypothetical protein